MLFRSGVPPRDLAPQIERAARLDAQIAEPGAFLAGRDLAAERIQPRPKMRLIDGQRADAADDRHAQRTAPNSASHIAWIVEMTRAFTP